MTGITDLGELLRSLRPQLRPVPYVVCLVGAERGAAIDADVRVVEAEGVTLVLPRDDADRHGLDYEFVAAWITLTVHSSLAAVGLTAAVAAALADDGISANVIAAFHHDHVLVPWESAGRAMAVLEALSDATA